MCRSEIGTCIINDAAAHTQNNETTRFLVESHQTTLYTHVLKVYINNIIPLSNDTVTAASLIMHVPISDLHAQWHYSMSLNSQRFLLLLTYGNSCFIIIRQNFFPVSFYTFK
jgi:hypothetical protein